MSRQLKCFVASAFERDDVDAIFDKAVRPVLKALSCGALRVDRVEHNDDIDKKLFELMDQCDFCIADLTYARPSVYYEAGYLFGKGRPVIYIAKKDHFKHRDDDPEGNLRVHFDLQMKNIIPWTTPNNALRRNLSKRIRHVLRPIHVAMAKSEKDNAQALAFAARSQSTQLGSIVTSGRKILSARWFKDDYKPSERVSQIACFHRWRSSDLQLAKVFSQVTLTKKKMNDLLRYSSWPLRNDIERASSVESLTVFASLSSVSARTVTAAFPASSPISPKAVTKTSTRSNGSKFKSTILVIDNVRSTEDFSERFAAACDQVGFTRRKANSLTST